MTCCFQRRPISSAKMRARMSVTLPAPNGTTMVTRWVGQLCANAGALVTVPAASSAARPNTIRPNRFIAFLLQSFGERGRFRAGPALRYHVVETFTKILEHHGSGIPPRSAGDGTAGLRGRPGLVEAGDRHAMLRPAGRRTQGRSLRRILRAAVTGTVPVVRIAALEIERALDHAGENLVVGKIGRKFP